MSKYWSLNYVIGITFLKRGIRLLESNKQRDDVMQDKVIFP